MFRLSWSMCVRPRALILPIARLPEDALHVLVWGLARARLAADGAVDLHLVARVEVTPDRVLVTDEAEARRGASRRSIAPARVRAIGWMVRPPRPSNALHGTSPPPERMLFRPPWT
jgi:hypothetical protein